MFPFSSLSCSHILLKKPAEPCMLHNCREITNYKREVIVMLDALMDLSVLGTGTSQMIEFGGDKSRTEIRIHRQGMRGRGGGGWGEAVL